MCGGNNRSRRGAETQQVLASILRTAHQRGLDSTDVFTTLLRAPAPLVSPHFYPMNAQSTGAVTSYSGETFRISGEGVGQDLERDVAIEFGVLGSEHLAHSARTDCSENLVGTKTSAG